MIALGSTAFRPDLTPWTMTQAAVRLVPHDPEAAEELYSFAADFAAIRELPTFIGWVRGEENRDGD
jgi:hypothetical protein